LDEKGVGLKVLDQAIDTTTPTGRLMFNMLGAIAQFKRELIRERILVGIAKAKAEGKYKGADSPCQGHQSQAAESCRCRSN
jgi:DNA invertase Pin-like site-specific DNA recombinase